MGGFDPLSFETAEITPPIFSTPDDSILGGYVDDIGPDVATPSIIAINNSEEAFTNQDLFEDRSGLTNGWDLHFLESEYQFVVPSTPLNSLSVNQDHHEDSLSQYSDLTRA